ncbi:MAG TPA: phosphate acyltransferase PlsX [Firmicutes bacterium]|nr:phosphate acyltransferase PlsX [Bacillota bacterium]
MRIAVDAMGGDFAPHEIVLGSFSAATDFGCDVVLVGDRDRLARELASLDPGSHGADDRKATGRGRLSIVHASQVVPMDEHHPAEALRHYRDSSILVACGLVAGGEADAVVSAGNTGAAFAGALLRIKRIPGIDRPAIGTVFPTVSGACFLIDAGANVDPRPHHLLSFGLMGDLYAKRVLGIKNPRVALLSNGEEEGKGNELVYEAFHLLKSSRLNFIGNIEGKDIPLGGADVVVTDGFTGNVVLKLAEGLGGAIISMLKEGIESGVLTRLGGLLMMPALKTLKKKMDYAEYGGAPLLGVNGVVIIAHGRSRARAVRNSIKVAVDAVTARVVEEIRDGVAGLPEPAPRGEFMKPGDTAW